MSQPLILHIDDDSGDLALFQRAVRVTGFDWQVQGLTSISDGVQFLHHLGIWRDAPSPSLVVVDLDVPGLSGFDLLRSIHATPAMRHLPVVVLSGNDDPIWRKMAIALGVRATLIKPQRFDELVELVTNLRQWLVQDSSSALRPVGSTTLRIRH